MIKGIDADLARDLLLTQPAQQKTEEIPLGEALNRVAAKDFLATIPIPPFDRSPYDGYAFLGEDTAAASSENPVELSVLENIPAGSIPRHEIRPGTASRIMTGAPIPAGANATVKYEQTLFTDTNVRLFNEIKPDTDIVRAGEDLECGKMIAAAGSIITPPVLGLLACQGIASIEVFRKPVVSVLSSGSELVEAGQPLPPGSIYNSNIQTIGGYLQGIGAEFRNDGVMPDQPEYMVRSIHQALEGTDMLITTGGVSIGDYDYMLKACEMMGAKVLFWKTAMKPGGSMLAAVYKGRVIMGLSGNPGSALLGLFRIAMPYIRKLCGRVDTVPEHIQVMLKNPLNKKSPGLRLLRGRLLIEDARAYFVENEGRGNGIVSSFVGCDLLGEIPAGSPPLEAGTVIKAWRIGS